MSEGIYRGVPPAKLNTDGTPLVDWSITGAAGGVGKLGKNKLKQRTTPIPNGAVGTIETDSGWYTESAHQGITFTTGDNILKGVLRLRHSDNSDISPSTQLGDIMLVEGSTIPSVYDADTNLYNGTIKQGYYMYEEYNIRVEEMGYSQSMATTAPVSTRCSSDYFSLKPNTTYSARLFNSAYNDIQFVIMTYSAPGTITPKFVAVGGKSIPENGTFVTDTEQWVELTYSHRRNKEYAQVLPFDMRPIEYEYCESFANLKAGTYKLMIDIWGNNEWYTSSSTGYVIGFNGYTGCTADNWDWDGTNLTEWFTLLSEDNTAIIPKTDILEAGTSRWKAQSAGAPFPNYYHREFTFTLSEDTKVGLFHRAYYESPSTAYPPYFRFMIVDSDVEAEAFETTGVYPKDMDGYSAWEKYQVTLPVMVSCADQSQIITFDLNDFLYSDDTISKSSTGVDIPTYAGITDISLMCEATPTEMYIRYNKGSIGMYCTICGYGGESKAVCPRCGATGYDLLDIPAMAQGPMYAPDELDLIRDEIGFTNPNLHRRAPDDLHIDGTYASINYPSSVPVAYSDIEITTEDDVMKISKYKGTETNICIPEVYVSAGVTTIGLGAFTDTDVVYVDIPDGITTIE